MISVPRFLSANLALVRAMPRPARIAVLTLFAAGLADGVLMPFFVLWAKQSGGVPTAYIGLLLACYAGGELLATPFVGGIADRLGRRPVLLASTAGVGAGFLLLYLTHGVLVAAISLIIIGIFESVLHPTAFTVITDRVPAGQMREHIALARVGSGIGGVIGPAVGALLVRWSLGLVFVGAAASLLTGALMVALFLTETRVANSPSDDDDDDLMAITAVFRDRRLAALLVPVAVIEIAASWIEAVLPLYATGAGTLTPSGVGLLFTYAALLGVVVQLPLVQAVACVPAFAIVTSSGACLALAFASLLASPQVSFLILGVTLIAIAQMLFSPLVQAVVAELAPGKARATYMAAFSATNDLKDAAGPAIGLYLFSIAAGLPWLVGLPVSLLSAVALALVVRRKDTAPVE
jgi:MFS family permease